MDGAIAILTGVSGEKIANGRNTTVGAATGGVEIVGTTVGAETAVEQVRADGGATATFAGGTIGPTIIAAGTVGIMTGAGIVETIDHGHGIFAGGETNAVDITTERGSAEAGVHFGYT